jgi:RNA polymerase sigma factor (sigma-70 family)
MNENPTAVVSPDPNDLPALVDSAATGDHDAYAELVRRFDPRLRSIARGYRLDGADVDDVVQCTWLRLLERIEAIRNPEAIYAWLSTTTRRNALATIARRGREHITDDPALGDGTDDGPEAAVLAHERRDVLAGALRTLPERHRRLMTTFAADSSLEYLEISELLAMPVGSIGPIRARSLERLARDPSLLALR